MIGTMDCDAMESQLRWEFTTAFFAFFSDLHPHNELCMKYKPTSIWTSETTHYGTESNPKNRPNSEYKPKHLIKIVLIA